MFRSSRSARSSGNALAAGFLLFAVGCASAPPPVTPPQLTVPDTFSVDLSPAELPVEWWQEFDDPDLMSLVRRALAHNRTLDQARANVTAAEALLRRARLAGSYSTSTTAGANLGRSVGNDPDVSLSANGNLGADWEFDAFDRIAAQIRSAEFSLEAARQARRDVAVIIAAQTADAYTDLRGGQIRLDVAQRNAQLQKQSLDLLSQLFQNGRATQLDVDRANSQYQTTLASLPTFIGTVEIAVARLGALLGVTNPMTDPELSAILNEQGDIPELRGPILTATPDQMIRRRPDIRQAEALLGQRLALSQVARARLFPTLTMSVDLFSGFVEDRDLSDSFGFGIGPTLVWEGPDLRGVKADIDVADADARGAIAFYEQTVFDALSEVETALSQYQQERRRRGNLVEAEASASRASELALVRFEEGLDSFLDV
ncbi:MAG: TolC family protein, partial [Pseudomonadota bacterium]